MTALKRTFPLSMDSSKRLLVGGGTSDSNYKLTEGLLRLLEGKLLDDTGDVRVFSESNGVLSITRMATGPKLHGKTVFQQVRGIQGQIARKAENKQLPQNSQALQQRSDGLSRRGRRNNESGAAECRELLARITFIRVDILVSSELTRRGLLLWAPRDRDNTVSHALRILDG